MLKDNRILVIIIITALLAVFIFALFMRLSAPSEKGQEPTPLDKREVGQITPAASPSPDREDKAKYIAEFNQKERSRGSFVRVEGTILFFKDENVTYTTQLKMDQVVIACTGQDFNSMDKFDYSLISKIIPIAINNLASNFLPDQEIVLISEDQGEGNYLTHTIAISKDTDVCK